MANEKLKPGFLDVLETGEVKVFENEEVQKNPKVTPPKDIGGDKPKWKTWNFDLFWCENSGFTGERLAKEIEYLFKQNGFSGQIRVRYLAESVTRRKNFGKPANFEIRVDAGEELSSAEKILELIGKSSSIKKEEFNIFKVSEKSKIPGYVSLFFCP